MKLSFAGLLLAAVLLCPEAWAEKRKIVIATAGETGVYYPVGGTICRLVNRRQKDNNLQCLVESTGGSIANLNSLKEGDVQFAFAQSDWQYNAYHGTGVFANRGEFTSLRSLFSLHSEALTIVARDDSGIVTFDQLKGHKVNIGNPGSGMRATMDEVMRLKGWTTSVFKSATEFKPYDQARLLCNRTIDAFVFATGHPNGSMQDVTSHCPSRIVSLDDATVDNLVEQFPYYAPATIPGGMYAGNPDDVPTFGVKATLVSTKDVSDDTVYEIVKAVFDNFDDFKTTHPILSTLDRKAMITNGLTAPLHEGAKRYYREVGLLQ